MVETRNGLLDFVRRTESNLQQIEFLQAKDEKNNSKHRFFEITQLINSCIGLVIFPYERAFDYLPDIELKNIKIYQEVRIYHSEKETEPKKLKDLIKKMRNSFAHTNMCFKNSNNQIVGVYLWGYPGLESKSTPPDWVIYIRIDTLQQLVREMLKYFKKIDKDLPSNEDKLIEIEKQLGIHIISSTNPQSFL